MVSKMKLLAISGGPDSMLLLNEYKNEKVIVAHVNYHKRDDSNIDENIVRDFCFNHNIKLKVLNVKNKHQGNFQTWARNVRYDFFKEIYNEYNCNQLIVAHHKDDFLETAIFQEESNRKPSFWGIKKQISLFGMDIYRPFIDKYWKSEIIKLNQEQNINYASDYSNELPTYTRNKIRINNKKLTLKQKEELFNKYKNKNILLNKKNDEINYIFAKWQETAFLTKFIKENIHKNELVFLFINSNLSGVKLSSSKVESIKNFILANNGGKQYKLNDSNSLKISNGLLKIIENIN